MKAAITVDGVSKLFGALQVLSDVSFEVSLGGFTCIVGPSGCGKTTLLRILLGLERASSGKIAIDEELCGGEIAYIPQKSLLLPWRTALQNVCLGLARRLSEK